ncbi:hypothetical protein [Pseudogemmobacter blasticus]|uniref:DUF2946 domain-containing protein n=1 Tax=Fuscovulum blasticum DSM 2131 TaxID=1188250 RepID=A0A2T4JBS3_FUSBL|nr:hypothetical protein [Fuscovulum blasticum]PTE15303.1 hypothetical protein C5F44_05705 [Fuscovulum blasticum DSM 2131]
MSSVLRPFLCLVAVLAVALYGAAAGAAVARGPVTEMVICADGGTTTILLDAAGNPVEKGNCCDCLKCLPLAAGLSGRKPPLPAPFGRFLMLQPQAVAELPGPLPHARPLPRGPPMARSTETPAPVRRALRPLAGSVVVSLEFGQEIRSQNRPGSGQPDEVAR